MEDIRTYIDDEDRSYTDEPREVYEAAAQDDYEVPFHIPRD